MYETPQVDVKSHGEFDDDFGKILEIQTSDSLPVGKMYVTTMENAKNVDPDFIKLFDEKRFQTIPLNYQNSLFMHSLNIDKNLQRKGFGSQLLDRCHEIAKQNGFNYLTFIADKDNSVAKNLYKKRGYNLLNSDKGSEFYFVEL